MEAVQSAPLLDVDDVAQILKVEPAWVRAHSNGNRQPTIPSIKMGKHRRFRRQDVMVFIDHQQEALEAA